MADGLRLEPPLDRWLALSLEDVARLIRLRGRLRLPPVVDAAQLESLLGPGRGAQVLSDRADADARDTAARRRRSEAAAEAAKLSDFLRHKADAEEKAAKKAAAKEAADRARLAAERERAAAAAPEAAPAPAPEAAPEAAADAHVKVTCVRSHGALEDGEMSVAFGDRLFVGVDDLARAGDAASDGWCFATRCDDFARYGFVPSTFLRVAGSPEERAFLAAPAPVASAVEPAREAPAPAPAALDAAAPAPAPAWRSLRPKWALDQCSST